VNLLEAAVLGFVQGMTEFLPISSTAHLRLVPAVLGWPDSGAAFAAVIQLGTLIAVLVYFFHDLVRMLAAVFNPMTRKSEDARMLLYIVVGTVPIGIVGILARHAIEGPLRSIAVIAASLILVGILMGITEKTARHTRFITEFTLRDALFVGVAQSLALIPGVSRSGITLVAAMMLGYRRDASARFSFLLSIPAVTAAGIFEFPKLLRDQGISNMALVIGLASAAISGYLAVAWLIRFLRSRSTIGFVVYRVMLGFFLLIALGLGWLS
jgi:undecaprenyl-diphosphatase